ncbi:inorganic phosphate transporter [Allisonella histaminiformans]|uniref:inorganic phosphate transporter n=1 Tax=Allisonella histaminiformans TaxID=209880 RepID=UPI002943726C|nr:inorganic phosphate transporter [Allisonella histaminiformans]
MPEYYLIIILIILALSFDFINGFHDTANAIATCVATRALNPKVAIIMSAVLNFVGAMVSTGVAKTIGGDIVTSPSMVDSVVLIAAISAAIFWNLLTWKVGLPSSSSHALIGGICGAVIISYGIGAINGDGILTIVSGLVLSPVVAMFCGYIMMTLFYIILRNFSKGQVNNVAKRIQVLSAALMAFSHGSNDAQKSMGIITLALLSGGFIGALEVPVYVKVACALAMSAGTSVGGWNIIRTVGNKIFRMQPVNGLAADLNSAMTIFTATMLHLPVSTTHVVTGSIMGVGWATRFHAVHWSVAYQMVFAWILTIPCTAAVGAIVYLLLYHMGL